jgi:hypothetical protein
LSSLCARARWCGAAGWQVAPACDLHLDTLEHNAHSTALDAIWAGVPLLSLPQVGDDHGSAVHHPAPTCAALALSFPHAPRGAHAARHLTHALPNGLVAHALHTLWPCRRQRGASSCCVRCTRSHAKERAPSTQPLHRRVCALFTHFTPFTDVCAQERFAARVGASINVALGLGPLHTPIAHSLKEYRLRRVTQSSQSELYDALMMRRARH